MGRDPARSVLNEFNRSRDVPSLFVTDASSYASTGAVGPTLTIMALTARACEHIATEHDVGVRRVRLGATDKTVVVGGRDTSGMSPAAIDVYVRASSPRAGSVHAAGRCSRRPGR